MNIFILILSISLMGFAIARMSKRTQGKTSRYERKPQSPWSALTEGEDPTV